MKKILKLTASTILCGMLFLSLSSFTDGDESAGGDCNLCVIKGYKSVFGVWVPAGTFFSCKSAANTSCHGWGSRVDENGATVNYDITCGNAAVCK